MAGMTTLEASDFLPAAVLTSSPVWPMSTCIKRLCLAKVIPIVCPKHFCGYVMLRVPTLRKKSLMCPTRSPISRFWFPSDAENISYWLSIADVIIYVSLCWRPYLKDDLYTVYTDVHVNCMDRRLKRNTGITLAGEATAGGRCAEGRSVLSSGI